MRLFLKLKHWQLFLLFMAIPVALNIIGNTEPFDPNGLPLFVSLMPFIITYFALSYFGWLYTITINLYPKLPPDVSIKLKRFKIFMLIPTVYIILLCLFLFLMFSGSFEIEVNPVIFLVVVPLHIFSLFAILHNLYTAAKALKAVEIQRPVSFSDFAGEFIMFWIFFAGIWILQPRINKIFKDE